MDKIEIMVGEKNVISVENLGRRGAKLIFSSFTNEINDKIKVILNNNEIKELIDILSKINTKAVKKEEKAYTDEISTYKNEVERSLWMTGRKGLLTLSLDCYTDKPFDDNWIILTPAKLNTFIGNLYGYIVG